MSLKSRRFFKYCSVCCLVLAFVVVQSHGLKAQVTSLHSLQLNWQGVGAMPTSYDTIYYIQLESACYEGSMPIYVKSFPIYDNQVKADVKLQDLKTASLSEEELKIVNDCDFGEDFSVSAIPLRSRDESLLSCRIHPIRKHGGSYEKLVSATLSVTLMPIVNVQKDNPVYAHTSAMASGDWYKIGLPETGIYKLSYDDLKGLGVNVAGIDPRTIRVYHNGGGVLPEMNDVSRHDDLVEIPIYVEGESDGSFDKNDYVLFYGRGPVRWTWNASKQVFEHVQNYYDDYAYAFVVTGKGTGKRITTSTAPTAAAESIVTEFLDYQVHESDEYNLWHWGRSYYGDAMHGLEYKTFSFDFPNMVSSRKGWLKSELAGRNFNPASFEVYVDEEKKATYSISSTSPSGSVYAHVVGGWVSFVPQGSTVSVRLRHVSTGSSTSDGFIDYLALNVWRSLKMAGNQMAFRNPEASLSNKVYEYRISGASQQIRVWNVSDPVAPSVVPGMLSNSVYSFKVLGNQDNAFVAFNGNSYCKATAMGRVDNQNLHGIRDVDYLILTHPDFMSQAERIKAIHNRLDPDLNVYITTPELVYNEFACGAKDVSAIRDFCRMLYLDSNSGRKIKYLLLLGDASYDHKNRDGMVDLIPAFESLSSLDQRDTFVTDDYYGFMDEGEGAIGSSLADIGIGRFPVSTLEQATNMVDKIERYIAKDEVSMQPWRNMVTFCTDDDSGLNGGFPGNAETLANLMQSVGGDDMLVDKIYLDAYPQVNAPGGQIAPEMNAAINNRMEKGTLVMNYIGHGGEVQLATEKILQRKDVDSWRNAPMFPLMITGTCEFSRYDDHNRTSLGEYAFLNQYGGMIAMFTTARITYGDYNLRFMKGIYNNLFRINGGDVYRLGDVYRMGKTVGDKDEKRYVFFGDPALRLAYPKWKVETKRINGVDIQYDSIPINDTISALQPVEIEGVVKDLDGEVASGFNGVVYVTVYDKETDVTTYGDEANPFTFKLRNSVVFNGKAEVVNGEFKINFIVPRDISYRYGQGLISYYATNYVTDAMGKFDEFIIGGFYDNAISDNEPPEVRLFIDDTLFISGGITSENPTLLAFVEDESGINTTGTGIGHDIMATLEGPSKTSYRLNDYFVSEINNPGKGKIAFKMQKLADGDYTLTLKVWDIYNNSNTASVDFTVVNSKGMCLENPVNYPNPVNDVTYFTFDHNQIGNNLKVQIDIFDIMGRWVTRINEVVTGSSTRVTPIRWDGRGAHGERLRNGVYVYRILGTNDSGETTSLVSKLILNQ